jgi:hypothetical protein
MPGFRWISCFKKSTKEIAFAQTCFAVQTRKQELIEQRLPDIVEPEDMSAAEDVSRVKRRLKTKDRKVMKEVRSKRKKK